MAIKQNLLQRAGFVPQGKFAREHGITIRTLARYRTQGLPWVEWNARIWIGPDDEAHDWLLGRVRRTGGGLQAAE